jgi:hypothetical protein
VDNSTILFALNERHAVSTSNSVWMLRVPWDAVNAVLDHLINDLGLNTMTIDHASDHYWHCPESELHDM